MRGLLQGRVFFALLAFVFSTISLFFFILGNRLIGGIFLALMFLVIIFGK